MPFQIHALPYEPFAALFSFDAEDLHRHRAVRHFVETKPGTPCRVSLQDAEPGETAMLLHFTHQPAESPFQASHAIYVRENAVQAAPALGEVPDMFRTRLVSLRAFTTEGMMTCAEVTPGDALQNLLEEMLADMQTETIHIHNAKQGCYLARATRA